MGTFASAVEDWADQSKADALAIIKEASEDFVSAVIANTPVDIGFLRGSLVARIGEPPPVVFKPKGVKSVAYDPVATGLVIKAWDGTQPLYIGMGANYARHVEYGTSRMQGRRMFGLAMQQFPTFVANRTKQVAFGRALNEHKRSMS